MARGYTIDEAWTLAVTCSNSVVDLVGGGYAVPVKRATTIAPPSKTKPIRAFVPGEVVLILPSASGWRIVRKVKP